MNLNSFEYINRPGFAPKAHRKSIRNKLQFCDVVFDILAITDATFVLRKR